MRDIRGLLSHSLHFAGRLSVDPTATTVAEIEQIRDHLISPTKALGNASLGILGGRKPTTIEPPRTLRTALQLMHRHDFSQLPVYDHAAFVGLLTNNAIARWIAAQMHHHDGLADDAPVCEVLPFAQDSDRIEHVGRDITAAPAVATFAEPAGKATPVTALIVTHTGKSPRHPSRSSPPPTYPASHTAEPSHEPHSHAATRTITVPAGAHRTPPCKTQARPDNDTSAPSDTSR